MQFAFLIHFERGDFAVRIKSRHHRSLSQHVAHPLDLLLDALLEHHLPAHATDQDREVGGSARGAVVACAGVVAGGAPIWELTDAAWDAVWSVNVLGTRRLIEAAAPTLIANGNDANGRVVAVASAAGRTGLYHLAAYSAAKHAVVGLIRGTAMDLAPFGVTANAVSPGSTRTALLDASAKVYELSSAEEFAQQQPMGRLIEPAEVAATIAWLCSPAASAITGADIAVDGGMTVG